MFWSNTQPTPAARSSLMVAMRLTVSDRAEPEQFLIAMLEQADTALTRACLRLRPGINTAGLRDALITASQQREGRTPAAANWSDDMLGRRAEAALTGAMSSAALAAADERDREALLTAALLQAAIPRVRLTFGRMGAAAEALEEVLCRAQSQRTPAPRVFRADGLVDSAAFRPSGRSVLQLIESEGKGLGLSRLVVPLMLFAHAARERGLLERALRLQAINPRQVHENLLMHLRALGKKAFNDGFTLHRDQMQPAVARAFERSAELAHEMDLPLVGEAELLKALLQQNDYFVGSFLESLKVDMAALASFVMKRHSGEEEESGEVNKLPSLAEIETRLRRNVVGQDHAIDAVMPIVKRMRFGYTRPDRPLAVLLFLGNSGTGKTQLAKELARAMYGSEDQLIFVEMGQFGDEHSRWTLTGAPPGFHGYGEGLLTNGLRDKPEAVVLFDEVEKAHRLVFDVLLRFLDEGRITDPSGPVRDGRKCIIILTSNHALHMLQSLIDRQSAAIQMAPQAREAARAEVRRALLETQLFRPEFLNRVDELILFNTFAEDSYRKILEHLLEVEQRRLREEKQIEVAFDESLVQALVHQCVNRRDEGARVCAKLVGDLVIAPLIEFLLEPGRENVRRVSLSSPQGGAIRIEPETPRSRA